MGLNGQIAENTNAQAGELIGAKAIITGKLVSFSKQKNQFQLMKKKHGLKEKFENIMKKQKSIFTKQFMTRLNIKNILVVIVFK